MKVQVLIPMTVVVSVAIFGLMKIRKKENEKEERRNRFQDIKLRVTSDVLREYQNEKAETQNTLEKLQSDRKVLDEDVNMLQVKADKARGEVDICRGNQVKITERHCLYQLKGQLDLKQMQEELELEAR